MLQLLDSNLKAVSRIKQNKNEIITESLLTHTHTHAYKKFIKSRTEEKQDEM